MNVSITTEIFDKRYNKPLKVMLGILIACDIIIFLSNLLGSGKFTISILVPLSVLIPAFLRMGEKSYSADVMTSFMRDENELVIKMNNVLIDKNDSMGREYIYDLSKVKRIKITEEFRIFILGDCKVRVFDQENQTIYEDIFENESFEILPDASEFEALANYIDCIEYKDAYPDAEEE